MRFVYPPATVGNARVLRSEGLPVRQIAAELGASKSTVAKWVRDVGPLYRECVVCGERFAVEGQEDANRRTCSAYHARVRRAWRWQQWNARKRRATA